VHKLQGEGEGEEGEGEEERGETIINNYTGQNTMTEIYYTKATLCLHITSECFSPSKVIIE
jgi:hypothetical protein